MEQEASEKQEPSAEVHWRQGREWWNKNTQRAGLSPVHLPG